MRRELGLALAGAGAYFVFKDDGSVAQESPNDDDYYVEPDEESPEDPPPREDSIDPIIRANLIEEYTPEGPYYFVRAYIVEARWGSSSAGDGYRESHLTYLNVGWQTGNDGFVTTPPVHGTPVRAHYFEVPREMQDSLSGYFPVIRGLPTSYVRNCRVYMVTPGGTSRSQAVQNGYTYTRDDLDFSTDSEKAFYVRHDGLIAFERLQVTDFVDGVTGLMVTLSGSAASLEGSQLSFEVWDRDPEK